MKKGLLLFLSAILPLFLSSCAAVEGIFKAGMGFGIAIVVIIIVVIVFLITRMGKK